MNTAIENLQNADVYTVDGSPFLNMFEQEEDDSIRFSWTDGEDDFEVAISGEATAAATFDENVITMVDSLGETVHVELFNLTKCVAFNPADATAYLEVITGLAAGNYMPLIKPESLLRDMVNDTHTPTEAKVIVNRGLADMVTAILKRGLSKWLDLSLVNASELRSVADLEKCLAHPEKTIFACVAY
jgi:hypothetical protein